MTQLHLNEYITAVRTLHSGISKMLAEHTNRLTDKSLFIEYALALEWLLKNKFLLPHEEIILRRDYAKIYNYVYDGGKIFYFSSFYYSTSAIQSGNEYKIQNSFKKMHFDIMAMLLNIKQNAANHRELGFSEDDCFFDRISYCNQTVRYILNGRLKQFYNPALYLISNLLQTLILYYHSGQHTYRTECHKNIKMLFSTLEQYLKYEDVQEMILHHPPLFYFIYDQLAQCRQILHIEIPFLQKELRIPPHMQHRALLRIMTSLANINAPAFIQFFETEYKNLCNAYEAFNLLEKVLFVRVVSTYLSSSQAAIPHPIEFNLSEKMEALNTRRFLQQVFALDQIDLTAVSEQQVAALHRMNDQELRLKFSKTIRGVDPLVLQREASKPHGSFEISDMEIQIPFAGRPFFLCMPFKSGVEIRSNSVPVDVAYQIFRPFLEFDTCMVVFVTAKKCSEQLMNYIKKMKDKMHWPIEVIEESTLAALLLLNGQL